MECLFVAQALVFSEQPFTQQTMQLAQTWESVKVQCNWVHNDVLHAVAFLAPSCTPLCKLYMQLARHQHTASFISCKFANSWLCSSTSSERQQCSLINGPETPPPNLKSTNISSYMVFGYFESTWPDESHNLRSIALAYFETSRQKWVLITVGWFYSCTANKHIAYIIIVLSCVDRGHACDVIGRQFLHILHTSIYVPPS